MTTAHPTTAPTAPRWQPLRLALFLVVAGFGCPSWHADAVASPEGATAPAPLEADSTVPPRPTEDPASQPVERTAPEAGKSGLLQGLPTLSTVSWRRFERQWDGLRKMEDLRERARAIGRAGIAQTVCDGLTDLRAMEGKGLPPFGWRDHVRGRTHASPVLAKILTRAYAEMLKAEPELLITLGDLAQPGCGPLRHGVLVRDLFDDGSDGSQAATTALNQTSLWAGDRIAWQAATPADFPKEAGRFTEADAQLRVETRLVGQGRTADGDLWIRTATTRYRLLPPPTEEEREAFLKGVRRILRAGTLVEQRTVSSWWAAPGQAPTLTTVWRQRWVDPSSRRQVTTVSKKRLRRRLRTKDLHEVRLARWQAPKPGSMPGEVRWWPSADGQWRRWQALYEAGHQTHVTGRDADIAYVTTDHSRHFAVDVPGIDAKRTWRWFQHLDTEATAAGVSLDRILVARDVHKHLKAHLEPAGLKTRLWRQTLRIVSGHDAHHHVRITPPSRAQESEAQRWLDALTAPAAAP